MNTLDIARTAADILEEKKGENILILDIQELNVFASYFVICSGTSHRMLDALADAVVRAVRTQHRVKGRPEGHPQDGWMVVDLGAVVVHLFSPDQREYYKLEDLWNEGKIVLHLQ